MLSQVAPVARWSFFSILTLICISFSIFLLTSCYSVRIASQNSTPEPDISTMEKGYYGNKKFTKIDTVIRINLTSKDFTLNVPCSDVGLYSVEYKVTLGGLLLSAFTFGRHRKVKITYVCVKEQN